MKKPIALLALLLALYSCSVNSVHLKEMTPHDAIQAQTTLTFNFDRNLAPAEKQDTWLDEEYISFKPKIQGRFKWLDSRTLLFSPEGNLPSSTDYSATITNKVLFNTKFNPDFEEQHFHTPYFTLEKADFFWNQVPHSNFEVSPQATFNFNEPVNPANISKYLEVSLNGQPVTQWEVVSKESSPKITLSFAKVQQKDKEQEFTFRLKKGLSSVFNRKPLAEDIEKKVILPPVTQLAITGLTSGYEGNKGWIEISTTQMVDKDYLKKYIELDPKKEIEFSADANHFRMEGDFVAGGNVDVKIKKGLPGLFGGSLQEDFEQEVTFTNIDPYVRFTDHGGKYMMLGGLKNLELESVNLPEVDITVSEIFQNNIVQFLSGNSYNYGGYEEEYYGDSRSINVPDNLGKQLWEQKIRIDGRENAKKTFGVNLQKALGQRFKGIYVVSASSSTERWNQDSKVIVISDLGMICKLADDEMLVFVNSIATTEPVAGAEVKIFSMNNQMLAQGTTGADGVLHIPGMKNKMEGFLIKTVLVEKGEDFNFVDLSETRVETSRFAVDGKPENPEGLDAFLYSERNLYRPGEDIHFSAIVRSNNYQNIIDQPFLIKLLGPTGGTVQEWKKNTNTQGSFEIQYKLPQYARTGTYHYEVSNGAGKLINSYTFSVEEFAPDKIRVNLSQPKDKYMPGGTASIDISAQYLFGAAVANQRFEGDIHFAARTFESKRYPDFDFGNYSGGDSHPENYFTEGTLNEKGSGHISYKIPDTLHSGGYLNAMALISVFDVTGRSVSRGVSFNIYTKNDFIGIKPEGYYHGTNQDINFQLAAVDNNDMPLNGFAAEAELIRFEWHSVLKSNSSGRYYYTSEKKEIQEWRKPVLINGQTKLSLRTMRPGDFELRLYKQGSTNYIKTEFYAWSMASNTVSSFEVNKEGNIDISMAKKSYKPGEKAKVLFKTPFSGKMLVTVERNKVYSYTYLDVRNNTAEMELPITEDFLPNVFVAATLFKKHSIEKQSPFLVGHGYASLLVEKPENKLPVKIIAPAKIRPRTTQTITIRTIPKRNVYITLAAVDEGILQIKNYQTPDPYAYMYSKRQLGVTGYDLYKFLLPEIATVNSTTGAGEGFEMSMKRSNPVQAQRFRLLSYWSGIRQADASGTLTISLPIPQFTGDVRLMAVAYSDKEFGSAENHMIVTDDVLLMPSIPRFLSQNDILNIPVTVMNTTDKAGSISVNMKLAGPLIPTTGLVQNISLKAKESRNIYFGLKTGINIGKGNIVFESKGMDHVLDETEIAVRPNSPLVKESGTGIIKAGENVVIPIPKDFLATTQSTSVKLSKFPALQYSRQLQYLLAYPYGCLEQTVSKLFPQLYFDELVSVAAPGLYKGNNAVYNVKEGIHKIESMNMWDGSISYWEGGSYANFWTNVYAAHFLLEAQKAGYDINKEKLDNLLRWIRERISGARLEEYSVWGGNTWVVHRIAPKEYIYGCYVLAMAHRADLAIMDYYRTHSDNLSRDEKYMLAGAFGLMNRRNVYNSLLPHSFDPEVPMRQSGDNFDSDLRSNAIMLEVLMRSDPNNPQVPVIVKYLSKRLGGGYCSTQDVGWAMMALGKAAKANMNSKVKVDIQSAGQLLASYSDKSLNYSSNMLNGKAVMLKASGNGQAYYFWDVEGVKLNANPKNEDAYINVRRSYFDRFGNQVTNNTFKQGQLIICRISLDCAHRAVDNIAVSDLIPAGFEIMNPRLGNLNQLAWIPKQRLEPQYIDIKDDRMLLFASILAGQVQNYYYMLRATNQGEFQLPPIGAEAMYDAEYHSYNGAGKVKIVAADAGAL